ncbi:MAG: Glutathione S-transferase family protein [Myxococcales bacterium]|nr:Glutathione S-transferase family protein [Myxococcales bacterium]
MPATLITIPFSHYCEKARWALERCGVAYEEDGHLPIFHYLANRRAGAKRTVPVVVDGDTLITDSTEIVAWADAQKPGTLLPQVASARAEAMAHEDDFDRNLGPATRRWGYYYMLPRKDLDAMLTRGVPRWQSIALKMSRPIALTMIKRSLKIDAAGAERSRTKIDETFERVSALLAGGKRYLVGDRFSVADLTFAALAAPVVGPREHPFALPPPEEFPPPARAQIEVWRASPAGQFALRIYANHRSA